MIVGARIYTDLDFNPEGGVLKAFRTRGWRKVMPNDIVVFNFPHHDGKINFVINNVYAKRCVAIPGDTLTIREVYSTTIISRVSSGLKTVRMLSLPCLTACCPLL